MSQKNIILIFVRRPLWFGFVHVAYRRQVQNSIPVEAGMYLGISKKLKVVLHETKGENEQTGSYICIRDMLKHTKKLFIPFLEVQNKAASLRLGNKTLCNSCYSPPIKTSILSCSILLHHCTAIKETFLSIVTVR